MGHLDSHVIFNRALFPRQSCTVGKCIPLRLQRASYRANNWSQTAQNWCRDSATEIGRKTAKKAQDAKMFDATECWEYVATVYRDILPGNLEWIAIHWQMLESAQNWSPNGILHTYGHAHTCTLCKAVREGITIHAPSLSLPPIKLILFLTVSYVVHYTAILSHELLASYKGYPDH